MHANQQFDADGLLREDNYINVAAWRTGIGASRRGTPAVAMQFVLRDGAVGNAVWEADEFETFLMDLMDKANRLGPKFLEPAKAVLGKYCK